MGALPAKETLNKGFNHRDTEATERGFHRLYSVNSVSLWLNQRFPKAGVPPSTRMERACPLFSPSNSDAGTAHGNYLTSLAADLASYQSNVTTFSPVFARTVAAMASSSALVSLAQNGSGVGRAMV